MALLRREFLHGSTCSEVMGIQWLAKPDLLPVRIPQVKLRVKNLFDKLKKIRQIILVGAPGFEPGTSCAQGRHSAQNNSSVFNAATETKQLSRDLRMWLAVRECPQMFVGWAQKLAHSKWYAGTGFVHGIVRRSHAS